MTGKVMSICKLLIAGVVSGLTISNTSCSAESISSELSVAEFMTRCENFTVPCYAELINIDMSNMWNTYNEPNPGYCIPRDVDVKDYHGRILEWLSQHPELYFEKLRVAATTAFKAVWPCK